MNLLEFINYHATLFILFPAFICIGFYLTLRLRFVQISHIGRSFSFLARSDGGKEGTISRFGAISAVLAGNLGTGNISGMAVALTTGGPGALVWMWIMAFFGAAIQFASCVLGVIFRRKTESQEYVGGPMYYLRDGLGFRGLGVLFAIFTLFGSIAVGNLAQINSIILPLQSLGLDPFYCSLAAAAIVGVVILGGIRRITHFASILVPFMALLYLGTAFVICILHFEQIPSAFALMLREAFGVSSVTGGLLGAGVQRAITTGFDRGLFATDAGTGIVPILQSGARSSNPVNDGIATLLAPLLVMITCTATGLVLILTGAWQIGGLQSTNMVTHAFSAGLQHEIGRYIVIVALLLFAYTTILAWAYCGEKALGFLIGSRKEKWFRIGFILLIPLGSLLQVGMIWKLSDIAITLMVGANLVGILGLSGRVIASTREFTRPVSDEIS